MEEDRPEVKTEAIERERDFVRVVSAGNGTLLVLPEEGIIYYSSIRQGEPGFRKVECPVLL